MSLLTVGGVGLDFGGTTIFDDLTFTIGKGERWGIIGRNGTGKTTLFRLLAGELEPSRGSISRQPGLRITHLDQHREFEAGTTIWAAAAQPFADLIALEASLAAQAAALAEDASRSALARYDHDLERFEREGGYSYEARVSAVLQGLGFDPLAARERMIDELSGGERGRISLARQLVAPADLIFLDEPTNHLDLETTEWLEEYLAGLDATVVLITHDRAFLEGTADHILHFEGGTATPYRGNYSSFVIQRAERRRALQRAYEQQEKKIAAEEEFIRRNIAGQRSREARGRRTRLARLPRLSPPPGTEGVMGLRLEAAERGGDQVVVFDEVELAVGRRTLIEGLSGRIMRGDRVGLIGPNGSGKSTLLRAIVGEWELAGGTIEVGSSIEIAYYRQDLSQLPPEETLFELIHRLRPRWERGQVMGHLGRFGFSGAEVERRLRTLSGGERARVALALIMLSGPPEAGTRTANLLIFDEPTNHLDIESIEVLEEALEGFDGTVLIVSHDRALLRAVANRVWILDDQRIEDFQGSYLEWEEIAQERSERESALRAAEEAKEREDERRRAGERARREREAQRARRAEERRARRALEEIEARITELEGVELELVTQIEDPSLYESSEGSRYALELQTELDEVRRELEEALEEWEALAERVG